jgi:SNF2 family DNA or RNA helicase
MVEDVVPGERLGHADLVTLSCIDDDAPGDQLRLLWQNEPDAELIGSDPWAKIGAKEFDQSERFAAYLRTLRWNCVTSTDPTLLQAPFRAGIRIDAYQLEPLRKALQLPRVNLFIADDVGLGKTIEAGLIARELLLRRRVDTIVIAAPPSMIPQWRDEMEARFGLTFNVMDREFVLNVRRERGYATNPWTTHSRFLVSQRLLSEDAYAADLTSWLGELRPKSLLILDEAHHAAPASGAKGPSPDNRIGRIESGWRQRRNERIPKRE